MKTTIEVTTETELSDRQIAEVCADLAGRLNALVTAKVTGHVAIHAEPGQSPHDALKRRDTDLELYRHNVAEYQNMLDSL